MKKQRHLVVFTFAENRYALNLASVERIVHALEITPLPKAPEIVLGVINIAGRIVPVLDMRKRFRLPEREIQVTDHVVIATTARRRVALLVDSVVGVVESSTAQRIAAEQVLPRMPYVEGIVKLDDGMVLIHDLDAFLSLEEEKAIDAAISKA